MKAYKGFEKHEDGTLWCRSFQYEVGKTYKFKGTPILCKQGFHACHEPWQCWQFYPNNGENVYYEVECGGTIIESDDGDGKFVCTEITLVKKIPKPNNKYNCCWNFNDGYAKVRLNDKWNFINIDGKYLSEQWFDWCGDFYDGCAVVKLDNKYNFIDTKGKYISQQWFDWCNRFRDGYVKVRLDGKYNLINTEGKYPSKQWFDNCWDFQDGYAWVCLNGKGNYINTEGKYLSEQWFDSCYDFKDGYAKVLLDGKWYEIDKSGKITEL